MLVQLKMLGIFLWNTGVHLVKILQTTQFTREHKIAEFLNDRLHDVKHSWIIDFNILVNGLETAELLVCCVQTVHYRLQVYLTEHAKVQPRRGNMTDYQHDADRH